MAEILETFDIRARYNHITKTVELSVALAPELTQLLGAKAVTGSGRRKPEVAGAGFEPATSGL